MDLIFYSPLFLSLLLILLAIPNNKGLASKTLPQYNMKPPNPNLYRISTFDIVINDTIYTANLSITEETFSIDVESEEFDMFKKWFNISFGRQKYYKTDHKIKVDVNGVSKIGNILGVYPYDFDNTDNKKRVHLKFDCFDL